MHFRRFNKIKVGGGNSSTRWSILDRVVWGGLLLWVIVTVALSLWGWLNFELSRGVEITFEVWLDITWRTIACFAAAPIEVGMPENYISLKLARVMAPVAMAGAIFRIGIQFFLVQIRRARIRLFRGHTVICGVSDNGLAFARSEIADGRRCVIIDDRPEITVEPIAANEGFSYVQGDPTQQSVLRTAGVGAADRLICCLPDDGLNLEVAIAARRLMIGENRASKPLKTNVSVADRELMLHLTRSSAIALNGEGFQMLTFSLSEWAARKLVWDEPLWDYAVLRGQPRLHAVFIGFDQFAEALIHQIPPACAHLKLQRPRFTILAEDAARTRGHLKRDFPQSEQFAEIDVIDYRWASSSLTCETMLRVSEVDPVSLVFVFSSEPQVGVSRAIYVQSAMQRTGLWGAPVFVRLPRCEGIKELLTESSGTKRFSDVVQPFGIEDVLCSMELLEGEMETAAERVHQAYQEFRNSEADTGGEGRSRAPLSEWRDLEETYRASNRRAVDNIRAKLASAGCLLPTQSGFEVEDDLDLFASPETFEALSELEHISWANGRYVDGWQYGAPRNDTQRVHPNLMPYEQLDEPTKELDREQIRVLNHHLLKRGLKSSAKALCRVDYRLGLIGVGNVSDADEAWLANEAVDEALDPVMKNLGSCHVTVVAPLNSLIDCCLAERTLQLLTTREIPHRLLIVESVPEPAVWTNLLDEERTRLLERRSKLIERPETAWIVDLSNSSLEYQINDVREEGLAAGIDYVLAQSHTVVVAKGHPSELLSDWQEKRLEYLGCAHFAFELAHPAGDLFVDIAGRRVISTVPVT